MMDLLRSKRVRITLVSIIVWAAARFGFELDAVAVDRILDIAIALVISFGATGWGKERIAEAVRHGGSVASVEVTTTIPPPIAPTPPQPPSPPSADRSSEMRRLRGERSTPPTLPVPSRRP